jgi:hypothetical protein
LGCALFSVCAGVPKLGQRGEVQDLMAKAFVGSNPTPCTPFRSAPKCVIKETGQNRAFASRIGESSRDSHWRRSPRA